MKKMVYVIITIMALVVLVNISAVGSENTLKINSVNGILEINPLY